MIPALSAQLIAVDQALRSKQWADQLDREETSRKIADEKQQLELQKLLNAGAAMSQTPPGESVTLPANITTPVIAPVQSDVSDEGSLGDLDEMEDPDVAPEH